MGCGELFRNLADEIFYLLIRSLHLKEEDDRAAHIRGHDAATLLSCSPGGHLKQVTHTLSRFSHSSACRQSELSKDARIQTRDVVAQEPSSGFSVLGRCYVACCQSPHKIVTQSHLCLFRSLFLKEIQGRSRRSMLQGELFNLTERGINQRGGEITAQSFCRLHQHHNEMEIVQQMHR